LDGFMTIRRVREIGVALCIGATTLTAFAQSDRQRFERQMEQIRQQTLDLAPTDVPADQRLYLDYGAYVLLDYLSVDDSNKENHVLRQYSLVPYLRLNLDNAQELFVRGRFVYRDFNAGDSFDDLGDEFQDPDVDRAYYRFDLARYRAAYAGERLPYNVVFQGGRDLAFWGNGLVLGQVLDGVNLTVTAGPLTLTGIAGVTPTRTVDVDSSRPTFDHNTRRGFYGGMAALAVGQHRPFAYGLVQRDYNERDRSTTGPIETKFQYDSYYLGFGSTGALSDKLQYSVEVVYEGGQTLSNSFRVDPPFLVGVDQTRDQVNAWALDARLDYLFNDAARSRVSAEFLAASGDDDRLASGTNTFGGNRPASGDRGFNGFGLLNTGLAFAPDASNLLMLRLGGSTFPLQQFGATRQLQAGFDFFLYGKVDRHAPINEPTLDKRYLGVEPDFFINWQVTSDVTLAARYGVFFPSSAAFVTDDARQFILLTLTLAF
jgi:hypothetical protein